MMEKITLTFYKLPSADRYRFNNRRELVCVKIRAGPFRWTQIDQQLAGVLKGLGR